MTNSYNRVRLSARLRRLALTLALAGGATAAHAQLGYTAANATNTQGTYTDLGTSGTAIATANTDDANSAAQGIGFTFRFNGTNYTQFVLNTNGFVKLGAAVPSGPFYTDGGQSIVNGPILGPDNDLLLPFNQDLTAGSAGGTEYRLATTGTTPNRVTTIQWKNISDKARPVGTGAAVGVQYANFSFQVKLYETTNRIEFVYGTATPGNIADDFPKFVTVGIKGSGSTTGQVILATKSSATPWANASFVDAQYAGNAHNVRVTELPTPGRTYGFSIPVAQDAAVQLVYGFDRLVVPSGQPVDIRAAIRNVGTAALSNLVVTLNVTGANTVNNLTQTIPSLTTTGANSTVVVTFPAVALPNQGNNIVTVTVPGDGNNTNNSNQTTMVTNATITSFITPGVPPVSAFGFGAGAQGNFFSAKISFTQPRDITAVNAFLFNDVNAVGSSAYGVVVDANTGALLGRSPSFVVTAASLNQLRTFTLNAPATITSGDVLIGMATEAAPGAVQFFLMGVQSENPTRPNTFYTGSATTAAPPTASLNTATTSIYKYMLEAVTAAPTTCPVPTAVTVTGSTQTSATISFTGPANGTGYQVIYGPVGFNPATSGTTTATFTTSPYTLTGLSASTGYDIYVRALCGATDRSNPGGPATVYTPCTPPLINAFPYAQNFDNIGTGQALPCGITVADVNNDGFTWRAARQVTVGGSTIQVARPTSAPNAMVYVFNDVVNTTPANDWFFTPALRLTAGRRYRLSFWYRTDAGYSEGLEVKYGSGTNPAGQTNLLYTSNALSTTTYQQLTAPTVVDITPAATGINYVGFHAISAADQSFLAIDDVLVSEVLATSAAMNRAVSVFPNPSETGRFNLEVRGANAASGLEVVVTNVLGQRVYTSTAKDNFRNELNLANLPAGIYTLKVSNGGEYMQQQISIAK